MNIPTVGRIVRYTPAPQIERVADPRTGPNYTQPQPWIEAPVAAIITKIYQESTVNSGGQVVTGTSTSVDLFAFYPHTPNFGGSISYHKVPYNDDPKASGCWCWPETGNI